MMSYSYLYDGVLSGFRCFKEIQVIAQKPQTPCEPNACLSYPLSLGFMFIAFIFPLLLHSEYH